MVVGSLKNNRATIKLIKGLMYNNMPIVEELTPFNAYKFRNKGNMVKKTAIWEI